MTNIFNYILNPPTSPKIPAKISTKEEQSTIIKSLSEISEEKATTLPVNKDNSLSLWDNDPNYPSHMFEELPNKNVSALEEAQDAIKTFKTNCLKINLDIENYIKDNFLAVDRIAPSYGENHKMQWFRDFTGEKQFLDPTQANEINLLIYSHMKNDLFINAIKRHLP